MSSWGIRTQMSFKHHPQTDGSSEIMNRMVETYFMCYSSLRQDDWDELLPAARFSYSSSKSEELQATSFEIDLGWNSRGPLDMHLPVNSSVDSVAQFNIRMNAALDDALFSHTLA